MPAAQPAAAHTRPKHIAEVSAFDPVSACTPWKLVLLRCSAHAQAAHVVLLLLACRQLVACGWR